MPLGAFSSESTTRVDTRNTPFSSGFSEIAGPATTINLNLATGTKSRSTLNPIINLTDQGALNAAMEISSQNLRGIELLGGRLEDSFKAALLALAGQSTGAIDAVGAANRGEVENLGLAAIKWGALVAGGYFLLRATGAMK